MGARQIAEAFHIPYAPADPAAFRRWALLSEWDMVRILSRGISSQRIIMRKELPPGMLLVDVVLRANLFPLQHRVQRRGAILEALFRISEGYYFGPHHLIMAALLHFEEKTLILSPAAIVERASLLTNGIRYGSISIPQNFPSQGKSLHSFSPSTSAPSTSAPSEPVPEAASSDAHLLFLLPQSHPLLFPGCRHLGLLPPAPPVAPVPSEPSAPADDATPVAVPCTVAAEDPSYPPEEPTT
ncbi:hypothetical protein CK203_066341 [Vitis vinifera]|uniref:Uncharacterized protein n=1 Tax=Vitis vinifera TaxID=29760 RepID=A0A438G1Z7_VITVI|nr:hypothetical protein CK203_066341 [Vitis vinifera]